MSTPLHPPSHIAQEQASMCQWAQSTTRPSGSPRPLSSPLLQHLNLQLPEPPSTQLAARTVLHRDNWAKITDSQWVLDAVTGYRMELVEKPYQSHHRTTVAQKNQENLIHQEVQILLDKGVVVEVPPSQAENGFYSTLFLVPVVVVDRNCEVGILQIESCHPVSLLQQIPQMCIPSILKCSVFTNLLRGRRLTTGLCWPSFFQRYLRFRWKGKSYQFRSLPFGLSTAPRTFTKVLRPVIDSLREMCIRCVIYLDDILIMNQDKELAHQQTWTAIDLLELVSRISGQLHRSVLDPVQEIVFLGFVLDLIAKEVRLPQQKLSHIQHKARQLLSQAQVLARALASFIG